VALKIDKGIRPPRRLRARTVGITAELRAMKVGDSTLFTDRSRAAVQQIAKYAFGPFNYETAEEGKGAIRLWRKG
jgi:hypothetical protein